MTYLNFKMTMLINENEIITLTNKWLQEAINCNASDIHFEPLHTIYRIRLRIDGVLNNFIEIDAKYSKSITVRLKIMAKLDISEQRLPQDGKLKFNEYTFRISTAPILYGEKIVLRIIDNKSYNLKLNSLGMGQQELSQFTQSIKLPQGLILITGPTGSGKTTTLYTGLKLINDETLNICSVEDPIEMHLDGINQTQVNFKAGLQFCTFLRSLLRQDPDVIMIGEIRDNETAKIAVEASQTGHLVLSTLHTNSSIQALIRLNQIGIQNYQIVSSLRLIIAQRLIRLLCACCKKLNKTCTYKHSIHFNFDFYTANGCDECNYGYKGRTAIYEFLVLTPEIEKIILDNEPNLKNKIKVIMKKNGWLSLQESAVNLVKNGLTSFEEITRVLGHIQHDE